MAHKTLINGTAYEVSGGKTLVNGTGYKIDKGRTLVNGTGYDISFLPAIGTSLNNMSWADIRKVSDAGLAASYFSVGDRKAVTLNGTVGNCTFSNETYYCYIIGIDHNSSREGANRIHFQFGYTALSGGIHIAFIDTRYNGQENSGSHFTMTSYITNYDGWVASIMKTVICPAFKNTMPSELQAVLKTVTKYSHNVSTGSGNNTESAVTATTDTIFLLAEWEVFGVRTNANSYEQKYQGQYDYYASGNSKVRYRHSRTGSGAIWWLRSAHTASSGAYRVVDNYGYSDSKVSNYSYGFAPAFCV